jgi:hypothetical protein
MKQAEYFMDIDRDTSRAPLAPRPLGEIGRAGTRGTDGQTGAQRKGGTPARGGAILRALHARPFGIPAAPAARTLWRATIQWILAAGIAAALGWLTYSRGGWIPFLSGADLAIHEFGHLLTMWAPPLLCSLAGSFLQVAAPLGLAAYFWWRRDWFAVIVLVAWAAESLNNVSVYVGDAQRMALALFGDDGSGAGHDWHNILVELGWLGATDQLANLVRTASVILFVVAPGLALLGFLRARRA